MENNVRNIAELNREGTVIASEEHVTLRAFCASDIEKKVEWINNPDNNAHLHYDIPICAEKTGVWFANKNNDKRLDLVIEYDGVSVGLIGLLNIDFQNQKAEYYISMGDTTYKRKGIATTASMLLVRFAFDELKLHKVYLTTDGDNLIAHRLFEKCGFVREGVLRDDLIHRGKFIDRIRYGILDDMIRR